MARIAFLGLGAMGSRMVLHLAQAGHSIAVWNRTTDRMTDPAFAGFDHATNPREAARNADFVVAMVRDDEASRHVWLDPDTGALTALSEGTIAIDCSTLSLDWTRELAQAMAERGTAFLDAPVVGSRPQAQGRQLTFLVGGTENAVLAARSVLETMGADVLHVGLNGSGTATKLAVNTLFGAQVCVLGELIGMLSRQGIDPRRAMDALTSTPVCSVAARAAIPAMLGTDFAPMFPVDLVAKDFGYALLAAEAERQAPMMTAASGVFARAIDRGFGGDNLTGIVRLYRAQPA